MPKSDMAKKKIPKHESVAQQILNKFYDTLDQHADLKDVASRFRKETSRSEASVKNILFGEAND